MTNALAVGLAVATPMRLHAGVGEGEGGGTCDALAPPVMRVGYGLLTYIGCLPANQPSRRLRMRSESQPPSSTAAR